MLAHLRSVPAFDASIPLADHQRAADANAWPRGSFGKIEAAVGLMVTALILFGGLTGFVKTALAGTPIAREVALLALFSAVTGLISIPFSYYSTFRIEEKFGFNKTSRATFWADLVR